MKIFFNDSGRKFISLDRNLDLIYTYINPFNILFDKATDEDILFIIAFDSYQLAREG